MIYILVKKNGEDYSTLLCQDESYRFIFDHFEFDPDKVSEYQRKIEEVLASSDVNDGIVFNGPAWLVAWAGYMWYSNIERKNHNSYQYCKHLNAYHLVPGDVDEY